jgi:Uma2 family endonuclease
MDDSTGRFSQGQLWTEEEYLRLPTNRLLEFDRGIVEVLPSPTKSHQLVAGYIGRELNAAMAGGGKVLIAPYPFRVSPGRYRVPDVMHLTPEQYARADEHFTEAAERVVEVVSPDDPARDYVTKREDYAKAGVPEYWIVDTAERHVLVLRLEAGAYVEQGRFGPGKSATSHRFPGLAVAVDDVLSQGK